MRGDKITLSIQPGVRFPGVIVGDPTTVKTETPSRNQPGKILTFFSEFVDVITMRTTREAPDGPPYFRKSRENVSGPWVIERDSAIVGLDATEDGEKISLAQLAEFALDSFDARQVALAGAGTVSLDELLSDDEQMLAEENIA